MARKSKADKEQDKRIKAEQMGCDWAQYHHKMPSQPEPIAYGNVDHDRECAKEWHRLTGSYPTWYKGD